MKDEFKVKANTRYRLKQSEEYIIDNFKRKFRLELMDLKNMEVVGGHVPLQDIDPQQHALAVGQVEHMMHVLGFLKPKVSAVQEQQVDDLYRLFKCPKD